MRILIKADWSDNNSTLTWKTPIDIRSFHLQVGLRREELNLYDDSKFF